ncbi:LADA_0G10968g1_1 [Lachancea dasiensis]|uniref:LADA_0G10968g1_1 n=1 Tax=Lachancea dasiensis TaxID=1072105 RepID=A0A1G4JUW5_9SACH|nr:LADA_0G10968g1_1 [Lachancea dasiensis]
MEVEFPTNSNDCDLFNTDCKDQGSLGNPEAEEGNIRFDLSDIHGRYESFQRAIKSGDNMVQGIELSNPTFQELLSWSDRGNLSISSPSSNSPGNSNDNGSDRKSHRAGSNATGMVHNDLQEEDSLSEKEVLARKKAQNRAAQKAFRERKEAKLKELESKLMTSERDKEALRKEIDDLKQQNMEITTENRLLLRRNNSGSSIGLQKDTPKAPKFHFPSQSEFLESAVESHVAPLELPLKSVSYEHAGQRLLTLPATWEYLHDLSQDEEFDVYYVMQNLKGLEVCHGLGPAYRKSVVDDLVRQCK